MVAKQTSENRVLNWKIGVDTAVEKLETLQDKAVLDCFKNRETLLPSLSYPGDWRTTFDH